MKEIKFRAYHKKEKRFYYFDLETCTQTLYVGYYNPISCEKDCELDDSILYSEKQLYTGLKDKNGKEIYEGDIVHCKYKNRPPNEWNQAVKYDVMFAGFQPFCQPVDYDEIYLSDYEVIGNIYENPELLTTNS